MKRIFTKKKVIMLIGMATAVGLVLWVLVPGVSSDIPVFQTESKYGTGHPIHVGELYVRTIADGELLITRSDPYQDNPTVPAYWPVYRYSAAQHELEEVRAEEWIGHAGPVTSIGTKFVKDVTFICRIDSDVLRCGVLRQERQRYETAGAHPLRVLYDPQDSVVAVLSADGWQRPEIGIIPLVASIGGGYAGQHYVEFFRVPSMERTRPPIRIPFTTAHDIGTPVWSANGRYLVYPNSDSTQMCVLHVMPE